MRGWIAALLGSLTVCASSAAWACPACASTAGTTTLAADDADDTHHVRASFDIGTESESVGTGSFATSIREWRAALGIGVDLSHRVALALRVPWVSRTATLDDGDLRLARAAQLGDVDLVVAWRASGAGPAVVQILAGARLPTGPVVRDAAGEPVLVDVQVGSGSFTPSLGLRVASDPARAWHADTSVVVLQPLPSRYAWQTGRSLQARAEAVWQAAPWLELAPGVAARHDARATVDGERDDDTGGTVLAATARARASHRSGVFAEVGLDVPVLTALYGDQGRGLRGVMSFGIAVSRSSDGRDARPDRLIAEAP